MIKVCLTGATGFIGGNLLEFLLNKEVNLILVLRNKSAEAKIKKEYLIKTKTCFYENNLDNLITFFNNEKPDVIIHLASLFLSNHTKNNISDLLKSNIKFGVDLLEAAKMENVPHFINTSTSWEHYNDEDYDPVNLYAATKKAFESILIFYVKSYNINAITLKLFDTYGLNDNRNKLINFLIKNIGNENEIKLTPGDQKISLVHVNDVCEAYYQTLNLIKKSKLDHKVYYLDANEHFSIKEIVEVIENVLNVKLKINWGGIPYSNRQVMNVYSAKERLPNWEPKEKFMHGLKKILDEK